MTSRLSLNVAVFASRRRFFLRPSHSLLLTTQLLHPSSNLRLLNQNRVATNILLANDYFSPARLIRRVSIAFRRLVRFPSFLPPREHSCERRLNETQNVANRSFQFYAHSVNSLRYHLAERSRLLRLPSSMSACR